MQGSGRVQAGLLGTGVAGSPFICKFKFKFKIFSTGGRSVHGRLRPLDGWGEGPSVETSNSGCCTNLRTASSQAPLCIHLRVQVLVRHGLVALHAR